MVLEYSDTQGGQNLDDNPVLPGLFEESRIGESMILEHGGGSAPDRSEADSGEPDVSGEVLEPETEEQTSRRKSSLSKRIDKLVRRRHEAEEQNFQLQSQLAAVTSQLAAVQGQLKTLQRPSVAPSPSPAGSVVGDDIYAGVGGEGQAPVQPDVAGLVKAAIQEAVAPLHAEIAASKKRDELVALRQQHEVVFADVAQDYPDLANPKSELREVFNQVYDNTPHLDMLADKPRIVATMARGLLADQRRGEQTSAARKRAAAVHTPIPAPVETTSDVPGLAKTTVEAIANAKKRLREQQADFSDYKLLRLAGMRQAQQK